MPHAVILWRLRQEDHLDFKTSLDYTTSYCRESLEIWLRLKKTDTDTHKLLSIHSFIHTRIYTYTVTYIHTYIHSLTHIHSYIHILITHIYIHTLTDIYTYSHNLLI